MSGLPTIKVHEWKRDQFLITTDDTNIDPKAINEALASSALGWACELPTAELTLMLERSANFNVFDSTSKSPNDSSKPRQIGLARLITDHTTFAYLTDVFIHPDFKRRGLGQWLIECVKKWSDSKPYMRRVMLVASEGKDKGTGEEFYARVLGTHRMEDERNGHVIITTQGAVQRGWDGHRE